MKTLHSKISRLTLTLTLVLTFIGATNHMKAQFTTPTFLIHNTSACTVDVFFEFKTPCTGMWVGVVGGFYITVGPGATVPVAVTPGGDALMRVFPFGYTCGAPCTYYFGDFSTSPIPGGCFSPSIPATISASGKDCNGVPNALHAVVNLGCTNCMKIW